MSDGEAFGPESKKEPGLLSPRVIQTMKALLLVLFFWLISTVFGGREDLNWQHIDWSGRVVAIGRDNTITIRPDGDGPEVGLRLYGLDLPTAGHPAIEDLMGRLESRYEGMAVRVAEKGRDRSGRTLALVYPAESSVSVTDRLTSINETIVMNGLGRVDRQTCRERFCGAWDDLEKRARRIGFGQW